MRQLLLLSNLQQKGFKLNKKKEDPFTKAFFMAINFTQFFMRKEYLYLFCLVVFIKKGVKDSHINYTTRCVQR
jgi:hypothetical protein